MKQNKTFGETTHDSLSTDEIDITEYVILRSSEYTTTELNSRLGGLGADQAAVLVGTWAFDDTEFLVPSDTTVINYGRLKTADNTPGDGVSVVQNKNATTDGTRDSNITFVNHGVIDGNVENQDTSYDHRHAIVFAGVDGLRMYGAHVVSPFDFAYRIQDCRDVQLSNISFQNGSADTNQDGLHFVDCSEVEVSGVHGQSQDDSVIVTAENQDSVNVSIDNIVCTSTDANIVRVNKAGSVVGDGTERRLENINITNVVGHCSDTGTHGIYLGSADADTVYRNVTVEGKLISPVKCGVRGDSATHVNTTVDVDVQNPGEEAINFSTAVGLEKCTFTGRLEETLGNRLVWLANAEDCLVDVNATSDDSTSGFTNSFVVHIESGSGNTVTGHIEGGSRGVYLGTGSTAATDNLITDVVFRDVERLAYEADGNADRNRIENCVTIGATAGHVITGARTTINGSGTEAAGFGAEPTAADWRQGTTVQNSDDGATWQLNADDSTWEQQSPADAANLAGQTASVGGFLAYDDGTNTTGSGELCQWDTTNSQWIPFGGSAAFS